MKMIKKIILLALLTLSSQLQAQFYQLKNFSLHSHYHHKGFVNISHSGDEINNAFTTTGMLLHAPFYVTEIQQFALESKITKQKLLSDEFLSIELALGWSMEIMPDWKIAAMAGGSFIQANINKNSHSFNRADPLVVYQNFSLAGAKVSLGLLQKYFWILADYQQTFPTDKYFKPYSTQMLNGNLGIQYQLNDWEIRLPIQAFDLIHFDQNNLYGGLYLAYKQNYIYAQSNLKAQMNYEIGFKPYSWLSIGFSYQFNLTNALPSYGMNGAFEWKSQKLPF